MIVKRVVDSHLERDVEDWTLCLVVAVVVAAAAAVVVVVVETVEPLAVEHCSLFD